MNNLYKTDPIYIRKKKMEINLIVCKYEKTIYSKDIFVYILITCQC